MRGILFAGGGTLGPVTPLLAVTSRIRELRPELPIAWAGTDSGPERELIETYKIPFYTIPVAKLPRYVSKEMLTLPLDYYRARRVSRALIRALYPAVVISAGGFTATPVVRQAADVGIPCIAHQLDYVPGLANRLIARSCRYITTSFSYLRSPFHVDVTMYQVPTPVRFSSNDLPSRESASRYFGFESSRPILMVMGGGTGAQDLNDAVTTMMDDLPKELQIIHVTGRRKETQIISDHPGYIQKDFLTDDMLTAYAAADVVVSRAGVGSIAELAATKKAVILVPLPNSPQEKNVEVLGDTVKTTDSKQEGWRDLLLKQIKELVEDRDQRIKLGNTLHERFQTDDGSALANLAISLIY